MMINQVRIAFLYKNVVTLDSVFAMNVMPLGVVSQGCNAIRYLA